MNKKVTIVDIARESGVSKTTISRFLNGKFDNMSANTRSRIEVTIARLDYHPNRQAQSLKARRSFLIGVAIADISNMYTSRLLKGIGDYFQSTPYQVLIMDADNDSTREVSNLEKMMTEQVDGVILQPLTNHPNHYQNIIDAQLPVVQVDRYTNPVIWPAIVSDNYQKSREVANLLKQSNYEQVVVLSNHILGISSRMNRLKGLADALATTTIKISQIEITSDHHWEGQLLSYLKCTKKTAIFALNGHVLWSTIRFLQTQKILIPDQVGVIGYDDDQYADMLTPAITAVSQNPQEIGRVAADTLIQNIERDQFPADIVRIPAFLHIRDSL